jgi:hypothetical protein
MSLKAVHIAFITLSVLLAIGFGVWETWNYLESENPLQILAGILAFAAGGGLIVYGIRFLRKLKNVKMI